MGRTKPPLEGGTILITGASSGIGREIARQLVDTAKTLVLVARREQRLLELKKELTDKGVGLNVNVQVCDLGDLEATRGMLEAVSEEVGEIDVLINNAGIGDISLFERTHWQKLDKIIRVNIHALSFLTFHLFRKMLTRGRGGILNVSSAFGLTFLPGFGTYAASKQYVTSFTEILRMEAKGTGVVVSQVCPGPVATEFEATTGNPFGQPVPKVLEISAEKCAMVALRGFAKGKALTMAGSFLLRSLMVLARITPRVIFRPCVGWIGKYLRRLPEQRPG
ncbi:MAG: SDR family oxidoreductase [Pseudomonadota bacterium]